MLCEGLRRVVVISDCHFGDAGALLARRGLADRLITELDRIGDIDMLVLLGDVWDLWSAGFAAAAGAGAPFFRSLASWGSPREFVLVAGNHDYHLWTACEDRRMRRELGWEEVEGLSLGLDGSCASGERVCLVESLPLWMHYPLLSIEVGRRSLLLMHGHHLDFFSRSFWWAKTAWLARGILGRSRGIALSDIDRLNKPFFELLTQTARVPELRAWEYRFYAVLRFFARLLRFQSKSGGSPRRLTSVEQNSREARDLLRDFLPGFLPDVFVFGHTHRAGFSRVAVGDAGVLMANTGCWVEGSSDETAMTYLVIDDAVRLRRLGGDEIILDPGIRA
ncbi:MAG: metallophosphoesterase [Actinomycetota bacterium]|nr:metallophosphoesterase [Actinomycetota bacterium]MDD5666098.1 metallophosphoesterase [Actinomycetota bacterium]